jgi:hypothetical protein
MSNRYTIKLFAPEDAEEELGTVQATKGQTVNLFEWHDRWCDYAQRHGYKRGLLFGAGASTLIYVAWLWLDWAVL